MIKYIEKEINIDNKFNLIMKGIKEYSKNEEILPLHFHTTFKYHYQKAKERNLINSFEDFEYKSDISEKTLRGYKNGITIPSRINIIKIGLALKLPSQYIIDLLEKADCKMTLNNEDNTLLLTVIYGYSQMGIDKIYAELKKYNKETILNLSKKYLKNHNFIK